MSLQPQPRPAAPGPERCPLCDSPIGAPDARCGSCNADLAGVGDRPGPFSPDAVWYAVAALVALYGVVLLIVALAG